MEAFDKGGGVVVAAGRTPTEGTWWTISNTDDGYTYVNLFFLDESPNHDSSISFSIVHNDLNCDLVSPTNGGTVGLRSYTGSERQKWVLVPA